MLFISFYLGQFTDYFYNNRMYDSMLANPHVIWILLGAALCLAEMIMPTVFTLFTMGLSAFCVGFFAVIFPHQFHLQIALWIGLSTTFIYLTHRFMPKRKAPKIADATEAKTLTEIPAGDIGRVLYEGNSWRARCGDEKMAIAPHQKVYIVGREGTTLIVMPENLLQ